MAPAWWITVAAALLGGLLGVSGGAVVRLALDRRQEQVRARAYARVIRDELETNAQTLEHAIETQDHSFVSHLSVRAWNENRAAVAAQVLEEEFLALSTTYRVIASVSTLANKSEGGRWTNLLRPHPQPGDFPGGVFQEFHIAVLAIGSS
jgi:hypothetical protein